MTNSPLSPGDIVLVPFPFTNYLNTKRRPALVLSTSDFYSSSSDVILVAISSNISRRSEYEVKVLSTELGFAQTGLKRSSSIKCASIFAFSQAQIDRKLGTLPIRFLTQVKNVLATILDLQVPNLE